MTARDFAYWLQGYFEIAKPITADAETLGMIQKHLSLVFVHEIDPSFGPPEKQQALNDLHNPVPEHLRPGGKVLPGGGLARC